MFTITSHQGNANPKSQDTISHPLGWPQLNKNRNQTNEKPRKKMSFGKNVDKLELPLWLVGI